MCSVQGQDDNNILKIQHSYFEDGALSDTCESGTVRGSSLRLILIFLCPGRAFLSCRPCLYLKVNRAPDQPRLSVHRRWAIQMSSRSMACHLTEAASGPCVAAHTWAAGHNTNRPTLCGIRSEERLRTTKSGQDVDKRSFCIPNVSA